MLNTHWACSETHKGMRKGEHALRFGCSVTEGHDPSNPPKYCYTCKRIYLGSDKMVPHQKAVEEHYACNLQPWEHATPLPGSVGGHRAGCATKEGHVGKAGKNCYLCRMRYLGRGSEPFLGDYNDDPHFACSLTPLQHKAVARFGRGHRSGCDVAEGHDEGSRKNCRLCRLLDGYPERTRANGLMRRYKITAEQYEDLLRSQEKLCAICRQSNPDGSPLAVDHDHNTGAIRGLLCRLCNLGIGYFQDRTDLLTKANDYLATRK